MNLPVLIVGRDTKQQKLSFMTDRNENDTDIVRLFGTFLQLHIIFLYDPVTTLLIFTQIIRKLAFTQKLYMNVHNSFIAYHQNLERKRCLLISELTN